VKNGEHLRMTVAFVGAHHRQIEMPGGVAAGEFIGAGGEQKIAGDGAQFGAVAVALVVHRKRLVARPRVHAEADMRYGIGLAVPPCRKIAAHQFGIGALARKLGDVIVRQRHCDL